MKAPTFLLAATLLSLSAAAQRFEIIPDPGKNKYGPKWEILIPINPSLNSTNGLNLRSENRQGGQLPGTIIRQGLVYPLTFGNMPCVIPAIPGIASIPNALPTLAIPPVAAIPNPLFLNREEVAQPAPLK